MKKDNYKNINLEKLRKTLKDVSIDKQPIAYALFDELIFLQETLEKLKQQVKREGAVNLFKQGKQEFLREHPALKSYNTTVQRYSGLIKQLLELLPKDEEQAQDDLLSFIGDN